MGVATGTVLPFIDATRVPYNARGNGTTDDAASIQAALDAAATSRDEVYLPGGTYKIATALTKPEGVVLRGAGKNKTTLSYTGSGTAIGVPASGVRTFRGGIERLTLTTTTGAVGIDLDSVSLATLDRIEVLGFSDTGIWLHSDVSGGCVYNTVADWQVTGKSVVAGSRGVSIEGLSSNANRIAYGRTLLCDHGVHIEDSNDNTVLAVQCETGGTGFYLTSSLAGLADWNRLIACRSEGCTVYGVDIASANVRHTVVNGHWFGSNGADYHDLGTKTRRGAHEWYVNSTGTLVTDDVLSAPTITLASSSGSVLAATSTGLYLRGNIPDNTGNVGVWLGNSATLANASARIAGFCRDTPVLHAEPAAYVRQDGAYEFANGVLVLTGSGTPEGAATAPVGSLYLRSDGGAGTSMYVKQSGTGSTGWTAK